MSRQKKQSINQTPAMTNFRQDLKTSSWIEPFTKSSNNTTRRFYFNSIIAGLFLFTLSIFATIIYLTAWYAPISRPVFTIVAESYATNLLVPQNLASVNSATKLAEMIENSKGSGILNRVINQKHDSELIVERLDTLIPDIRDQKKMSRTASYFLLQISAHGMVDENGPYLLKDWVADTTEGFSQPAEKDKVRLLNLLKNMVEIANGIPTAVVLNCENTNAFKELGVWGNEFSESVLDLEPWIENQPNLIVILTTGKAQVNCIDSKAGESLYGRIWRESMTNEKELGETFNLSQLHHFVTQKVQKEAAERFGMIQQPVLLPRGHSGESRASKMNLLALKPDHTSRSSLLSKQKVGSWKERLGITTEADQPIISDTLSNQIAIPESISRLWAEYGKLNQSKPHPSSFKPDAWAVYKAAVLRFEELILNKSYLSAAKVKKHIDRLQDKIENSSPLIPLGFEPSLAFSESHLSTESKRVPQWLVTAFEREWKKENVDVDKVIREFSNQYDQIVRSRNTLLNLSLAGDRAIGATNTVGLQKTSDNQSGLPDFKTKVPNQSTSNIAITEKTIKKTQESNTISGSVSSNENQSDQKPAKNESTESKSPPAKPAGDVEPAANSSGKQDDLKKNADGKTNNTVASPATISPEIRFWLLHLIKGKIQTESTKNLDHASRWINRIIPQKGIHPLELHIIELASNDFRRVGLDQFRSIGQDSIYHFVDVVTYAERAFAGLSDNTDSGSIHFNHTYFWIKPWFDKAEYNFLVAWDYLFSNDDSMRSKGLLIQRETILKYKELLARSGLIQNSLEKYYDALERLPELSFWTIRSQLIDYSNESQLASNQILDQITLAWDSILAISKLLENEKNEGLSIEDRGRIIADIATKSNQLANSLEMLENQYMQICRRLVSLAETREVDSKVIILLAHALRIPPENIEFREVLLKTYLSLVRRDEVKLSEKEIHELTSGNFELANYMCQKIEEMQFELNQNKAILTKFNVMEFNNSQEKFNVGVYNSIYSIRLIKPKLRGLEEQFQKIIRELDPQQFWTLDRYRRIMPLSMMENTDDNFTFNVQKLLTAEHLRYYARRLWNAHWGAIDETANPYYKELSFLLNEEAARISPHEPTQKSNTVSLKSLLASPGLPEFSMPKSAQLEGDSQVTIPIRVEPGTNDHFPEGLATILLQPNKVLELERKMKSGTTLRVDQLSGVNLDLYDKTWDESQISLSENPQTTDSTVRIGFLFRGNYEEKEVPVTIRHLPNWRDYRTVAPAGGSLTLRADPGLLSKLGRSGGNVSFVLDCSGSMGLPAGVAWNSSAKYAQAVESLMKTISSLPDETNISIWVFGEASGPLKSADPASTIRQVLPFTRWNSSDLNLPERIRELVSYPACEPWNKSPIIDAMQMAKDNLLAQTGPKAMIVITDGQDNVFGKVLNDKNKQQGKSNIEMNNEKLSRKIRTMFAETNISVNVIGYKLSAEEQIAVEQQFSVVQDLGVPGVFTHVNEDNELIKVLLAILRKRLVYRIESVNLNPVRSDNIDGTEIQPIGSAIQWASPLLGEDVYNIWLNAGNRVDARVFIQNGRRELFKLVEDNSPIGLSLKRDSWINTDFPWRPQVSSRGWTLSWIGSKLNANKLEMLLAIEKTSESESNIAENPLFNAEPVDLNLVIQTQNGNDNLLNGELRRLWNYPSNVWKLTLFDWNITKKLPSVKVLMEPGRHFDPLLSLFQGKDYTVAEDLVGRNLASPHASITIERFQKQMRFVADEQSHTVAQKPCWVIRTRVNGPYLIRADLEFTEKVTVITEYRYFSDSRVCETIIWPVEKNMQLDDLKTPTAMRIRPGMNSLSPISANVIQLDLGNQTQLPSDKDPWPTSVEISSATNQMKVKRTMSGTLPPALGPAPIFIGPQTSP